MNHTDFFNLIQQDALCGGYLLHGTEEYVKQSALNRLEQGVEESARSLNVQSMEAPPAQAVVAACETLPFFAKRRLVIVREPPQAEEAALAQYLPCVPETALLILVRRGKADARGALLKAARSLKHDVEFAPLEEAEAVRWVQQRALRQGVQLQPAVARTLVAMVGEDVSALANEFDKAAAHAGPGNAITGETLTACVTRNLDYELFPILDDLLGGRVQQGLKALTGMLRAKQTAPIPAAAALARQCRLGLQARLLLDQGVREDRALAARMGCKPFAARQALRLAKSYPAPQLKRAVLAFCDVEHRIKTGQAPEAFALDTAIWEALLR